MNLIKNLNKKLRGREVLARRYKQSRIDNYVRMTIGTDEEMDSVIKIPYEILSKRLIISKDK